MSTAEETIAIEFALKSARGKWQRDLVRGYQMLSLADLKGEAKNYSGHYARSRDNLLERLEANPLIEVEEWRGPHNKRNLTIRLSEVGRIEAVKRRLLES